MMSIAVRILQLGAIAVVLAVSTNKAHELDRFLFPKEIVLHATAILALAFSLRWIRVTKRDWLLIAFLVLSAVSVAMATDVLLGVRAFAVSASGIAIYLVTQSLCRTGNPARPGPAESGQTRLSVLHAVALAIVLASITSLAQAYGVETDLFTEKRAPGGTLGNRNFVGHAAAFGLPIVLLVAVRGSNLAPFGVAIVTASLVLTRSRAAWIAAGVALLIILIATIVRRTWWKRFAVSLLFAAGGVAAAILIPNELRWRSDNPYLDSLEGVVSYDEGSGRGRLIQYERSLRMAADHPLLGVGPGNWPVVYPKYAARRDPSMDRSKWKKTYNPWPSSDWIAFLAERGFAAAALLAIFIASVAIRRINEPEDAALVAMLAAVGIAGAFDAVLLLALPTMLVWMAVGGMTTSTSSRPQSSFG